MIQILIFVFGSLTVCLVGSRNEKIRGLGYISGFISQPFWFYETFTKSQWGIFAMSFLYFFMWTRHIYVHYKIGGYGEFKFIKS